MGGAAAPTSGPAPNPQYGPFRSSPAAVPPGYAGPQYGPFHGQGAGAHDEAPPGPGTHGGAPTSGGPGGYGAPTSGGPGGYGAPTSGGPGGYGTPTSGAPGGYGVPTSGGPGGYGTPTLGGPGGYGIPTSGGPGGYGAPTSGGPGGLGAPTPGGPGGYGAPTSGEPSGYIGAPTSGGPAGWPTSGAPAGGVPAGGGSAGTGPVDAFGLPISSPSSGALDQYGLAPTSADRFTAGEGGSESYSEPDRLASDADRFGFDTPVNRGPRIEPSPKPQRGKLLLGLAVGLLVGLLVFGIGGFFTGRLTANQADPKPGPTAQPSPSLGVYEQSQIAINQPKLTGGVSILAQGWLPYLSSCDRSGTPGGPALNKGEVTRVRCRLDGMSVIFVKYATLPDRDKARFNILSQNVDARALTPGAAPAGEKSAPSGRTSGSYAEFAYTLDENKVKQTVAGIWWDDTETPAAAYMLGFWKAGLGESWEPMRDVWARYA